MSNLSLVVYSYHWVSPPTRDAALVAGWEAMQSELDAACAESDELRSAARARVQACERGRENKARQVRARSHAKSPRFCTDRPLLHHLRLLLCSP